MKVTPELAESLTRRQWYDTPGGIYDTFSDGSIAKGCNSSSRLSPSPSSLSSQDCLQIREILTKMTKKVSFKPPAGDLRRKDLQGAWMRTALILQEIDRQKAMIVVQQKREMGLAKQMVAGLKRVGVAFDVIDLSVMLRDAFRYTDRRNDEEAQTPAIKRSLCLLDACLKFDVKKAATLLDLNIAREKTFGYSKR